MHDKFQFICRKYVVCARRGKTTTIAKRGKTSSDKQARENKQRLPSAGKQATIAKRGKTSNDC